MKEVQAKMFVTVVIEKGIVVVESNRVLPMSGNLGNPITPL